MMLILCSFGFIASAWFAVHTFRNGELVWCLMGAVFAILNLSNIITLLV